MMITLYLFMKAKKQARELTVDKTQNNTRVREPRLHDCLSMGVPGWAGWPHHSGA